MFGVSAQFRVVVIAACHWACAVADTQYLIISQPLLARVVYVKVFGGERFRGFAKPQDLITENLQQPSGLAVDKNSNRLFVCDPMGRSILYYGLAFSEEGGKAGGLVVDGPPEMAATDVEAHWVAVDGVGNVFFTDKTANKVMVVRGDRLGDKAELVYQSPDTPAVSLPGGIATDNFHVFWANGALGTQMGSVVKGFETPPESGGNTVPLAVNVLEANSVCLATTNAFFTGRESYVYAVNKDGGLVQTITDKLLLPEGCVWDGDGTVYVADRGNNAIYSFAGQMHTLQPALVHKVVAVDGPFGVAVLLQSAAATMTAAVSSLRALALGCLLSFAFVTHA